MPQFSVFVSKADFKFNCAHFIAFKGFRERLHGHNYSLLVKVTGGDSVGPDGYVIDFGDIKKATRKLCKDMNEYFICPMRSDVLNITEDGSQLCVVCEDGAQFSFPKSDCAMLPLVHSSAEELSHYFWCKIVRTIGLESLLARNIDEIEVSVAEAPQQLATFTCKIPKDEEALVALENSPIHSKPSPCFDEDS